MRRRRSTGGVSEAIRRRHAWLELIETSGPFLALPVVHRVFEAGLPATSPAQRGRVRELVADMLADHGASRHVVIETMLRDVLDWGANLVIDDEVPALLTEHVPGLHATLRPDVAFQLHDGAAHESSDESEDEDEDDEDGQHGGGQDAGGEQALDVEDEQWRMLGMYLPWGQHPLQRTKADSASAATGVDRLAALLRARGVPIGLLTDGRWWGIVWAPRGGTTGVAIWDASLFGEETQFFDAFVALLTRARFLGVADTDRLPRMLRESLDRQEEVTEALGTQVRDAVELLLAKLDQLDRDSGGRLLATVTDDELYSGVVTVMMRVVFLLFAEERRMLPSDDDTYIAGYSVGYLVDQLTQRASLAGEQTLAHRTAAWHRLLALTRAVFAGIAHENLRLPAYGGDLFDPDRYPWLEGRQPGQSPASTEPPAVDDLTVLRMLRAVQYVTIAGESRRLTFRALDVEQIGYVYEGLLELEVRTAEHTTLHLIRPASWPRLQRSELKALTCDVTVPEIADAHAEHDDGAFATWLSERCALTSARVAAAVQAPPSTQQQSMLRLVLPVESGEYGTIQPLLALLRHDERGLPAITPAGGRYITTSGRRSSSGTHYTPRFLAEDIVRHALEPLVYRPGPLETAQETDWELRAPSEILALRIADIAMGSGAFLVAACRYLADRLVQAWEQAGRYEALRAAETRAGHIIAADSEVDAVVLDARRQITEHCLYGADINPLAVSMAKLSLWLITMDRERPFGFLDDRLVCGDSLLGIVSRDQLETLHVDPKAGHRINAGAFDLAEQWRPVLQRTAELRRRITATPAQTIRDIEHKTRLLSEAQQGETALAAIADAITATGLAAAKHPEKKRDNAFIALTIAISNIDLDDTEAVAALGAKARDDLQLGLPSDAIPRESLHWPLAFPEIFADTDHPGFDAIIGNPPFLGGQMQSGALGSEYSAWLQRYDGNGVKGSGDLAARFVLRAVRLLNQRGQLGYVTTNTLIEGATLRVGMEQVAMAGTEFADSKVHVRRARSSHPWPTRSAKLQIIEFWASCRRPSQHAALWLDGETVPSIGPDLEIVGTLPGRPEKLLENEDIAYQGSNILGLGFTLTQDERDELVACDRRNAAVIQPYVIGKDLNQRPDCSASRWVINFRDWPLERAEQYPDLIAIVRRLVKPERDKKLDRQRREIWWRFTRPAQELYAAIEGMDQVLSMSLVGSTLMPARLRVGPVFAHKCVVFALGDFADLAVMSSNIHASWVIRYTGTMRADINYSPSDVFLTLPRPCEREQPAAFARLRMLGKELDSVRGELMLARGWGLTTTYKHVFREAVLDPEVQQLRKIHAEIDRAVLDAYGWSDLDPEIGFHPTKIGVRWTLSPRARFEVLDRLRVENQRRFEAQPR